MKKKIFIIVSILLIALTCGALFVSCTDAAVKPEVEVQDCFATLDLGSSEKLPGGGLSPWSTEKDLSPGIISGEAMGAKYYINMRLNWNFEVAKKYNLTKVTFDFIVTQCTDVSEITLGMWGNGNLSQDDVKQKNIEFTLNEKVPVEFDFSDDPIQAGKGDFESILQIMIKNSDKINYMLKVSNFKIYGIEK